MTDQERQKKATEIAIDNGYDLALYVGSRDGMNVYLAGTKDRRATGLPEFIVFDQSDKPEMIDGFVYMDLVDEYVKQNGEK